MAWRFKIDDECSLTLSGDFQKQAEAAHEAHMKETKTSPSLREFCLAAYSDKINVRAYASIGYAEFVKLYKDDKIVSCTDRENGKVEPLSQTGPKDADAAYLSMAVTLDETKRGSKFVDLKTAPGYKERRYVRLEPEIFAAAQAGKPATLAL